MLYIIVPFDTLSVKSRNVLMTPVYKCCQVYTCKDKYTTYGYYLSTFVDTEFPREAMKKGYIYLTLVKVIIEGPAGVGKTCLMHLLLGKTPPSPEQRHSTGCAERAIQVIRVGKEGEKWSEISREEFEEMIAKAVPILYKELKAKGQTMEPLANIL